MLRTRLFALFSFVLALSALAENPAVPVTELNRIAPKPGLPYVELDGKLHFKNSADRVNFAGELGIAGGVVGVTSVDGMSGNVALDLPPTPQQYGAIADGASHPVSEWLTNGAHPRGGYTALSDIQVDYPHVVSLTDESDWAAGQKVLETFGVMGLPSGYYVLGNSAGGHAWEANKDQNMRIVGSSRFVEPSSHGVQIHAAAGTDGIRFAYSSGDISDVTIYGASVSISSIVSASHTAQAVVTTAAAHGLRTAPFVSGGWTITGNTVGAAPVITTSQPHGLSSGEYISISGSTQASLNHIFRVLPTDASGNPMRNPSTTCKWFRLATVDHIEPVTTADGGAAALVRLYDVAVGPSYGDGREVKGAVPEVIGYYRALPLTSTTFQLFKWDNTAVVLTTDATANTGVVYTTQRALVFGDDNDILNGAGDRLPLWSDADSGREFEAHNIFTRDVAVGIDGRASDGSGKIDHCFADTVAIGFLAGGNIDKMEVSACWITSSILTAYAVNSNGGMTLLNSGGANNARLAWMGQELNGNTGGGSHLKGVAVYNEGIQRAQTAQGDFFYVVDCGINNRASFDDLVVTAKPGSFCDFHIGGPAGYFNLLNSPGSWLCYNQGGQATGDVYSALKVNMYGSTPIANDYRVYQAGDYYVYRSSDVPGTDIPSPTVANTGREFLVLPETPVNIQPGLYRTLNFNGTPTDVRIGFDTLEPTRGGTGLTGVTAGDLLYGSATNVWSRLPKGSDGKVLTLASGIPAWQDAPGGVTTYVGKGDYLNLDTIHQTLTNYVSIAPTGGVPIGTYKIIIEGGYGIGGGGAGLQWDLKGGTATLTTYGEYRRQLQWSHSGSIYELNEFSSDDGTNGLSASIINGEFWGTGNPNVIGAGRSAFRYEGTINVTVAGSIILRVACADATNGTTITDEGQVMKGTSVTLIRQ